MKPSHHNVFSPKTIQVQSLRTGGNRHRNPYKGCAWGISFRIAGRWQSDDLKICCEGLMRYTASVFLNWVLSFIPLSLLGNRLVINQSKRPIFKNPLESPVLAHLRFPIKKKVWRNCHISNALAMILTSWHSGKLPIRWARGSSMCWPTVFFILSFLLFLKKTVKLWFWCQA